MSSDLVSIHVSVRPPSSPPVQVAQSQIPAAQMYAPPMQPAPVPTQVVTPASQVTPVATQTSTQATTVAPVSTQVATSSTTPAVTTTTTTTSTPTPASSAVSDFVNAASSYYSSRTPLSETDF